MIFIYVTFASTSLEALTAGSRKVAFVSSAMRDVSDDAVHLFLVSWVRDDLPLADGKVWSENAPRRVA